MRVSELLWQGTVDMEWILPNSWQIICIMCLQGAGVWEFLSPGGLLRRHCSNDFFPLSIWSCPIIMTCALKTYYFVLPYQQVAKLITKEFGNHPKVYIWNGEGKFSCFGLIREQNNQAFEIKKSVNMDMMISFQIQIHIWGIWHGLMPLSSRQILLACWVRLAALGMHESNLYC